MLMKTLRLFLIFVATLCLVASFTTDKEKSTKNPLKGTWRAAYDLPDGMYGVKSFTDTHFNWYYANEFSGAIQSTGAGTYKITSDSTFTERVEAANPIFDYVGNTAMLNYKIVDDTLYTRFTLVDHRFAEKWIRVQ